VSHCLARARRPRFDVGDIVRTWRAALEAICSLMPEQKRALTAIEQCRTEVLGGHLDHCPSCGYEKPAYNSCRNRHCPKCGALRQERWIAQRVERMLDVRHFHVVFTLPSQLRKLAWLAPWVVFSALFRAAADTLRELGESRLGAMLGATLVLHTWARDLSFHPHVHAIVTAGGLSLDGQRFLRKKGRFLFDVTAMGLVLRGKVLALLSEAYNQGAFAHVRDFQDPSAFPRLVTKVSKLKWNVYAKAPLKTSNHVVAYLGRYTHRVGIANSRLLDVTDEHVVFRTRGNQTETVTPVEFVRRLALHVLPDGFHKIRHYGLYASPDKLDTARKLLGMSPPPSAPPPSWQELILKLTGRDVRLCPVCLAPLVALPLPPPLARAPP
jgi:hypothetical protein